MTLTADDNHACGPRRTLSSPGLILVHAGLDAPVVRKLLPGYWPDGDLSRVPAGYVEVSSAFPDLRAFQLEELPVLPRTTDPELLDDVRVWVDQLTHRWDLGRVFAAGGIDFWSFLRDRLIDWFHQIMIERAMLERLAAGNGLIVLGTGLDAGRRALLRQLAEFPEASIQAELAYVALSEARARETVAGRRFRKLFFLLQDAWHGVRFLLENLTSRKLKVLLVSDPQSWARRPRPDGTWTRSDIHLETIWRAGLRRPLRLYYRAGSYHPEVGAMTAGRLAPTYLRHFLFILAQTSRGFRETRGIWRKWRRLMRNAEFASSLVFRDLPVGELVVAWLDEVTRRHLQDYVRDTRRETHFLRGVGPEVILMTHELEGNRPILVAAKRLGIPTVAVQLHPFQEWAGSYLAPAQAQAGAQCLPERLCVFNAADKARLVAAGAFDPSAVVVTGDPRVDALREDRGSNEDLERNLRRRWGVEAGQMVIALVCGAEDQPHAFRWMGAALRLRQDAFVAIRPAGSTPDDETLAQRLASACGLRWFCIEPRHLSADLLEGVDLLVTSHLPEVAAGIQRRTPVIYLDNGQPLRHPDPGDLICRARSATQLAELLCEVLAGGDICEISAERRQAFLDAVYGPADGRAAARVLDVVAELSR